MLRMLLANVIVMVGSMLFAYLNSYFLAQGLSRLEVGLADGGFWLASVFVQPWLGPRVDRRGPIFFVRAGVLLLALSALGYCFLPVHFGLVFLLRLVHGIGFALYLPAAWAWVAEQAPPGQLHAAFGRFGLSGLGGVFGPVVAERLRGFSPPFQDQRVFAVSVGVFALGGLIVLSLKDAPRATSSETHQEGSLWQLAGRPQLRSTLLGSLSFGLAVGSLFAFVAPYLEGRGIEVPPLFGILTVVAGLGRAACGRVAERFGATRLVAPCLMALALGCAGLGTLQWLPLPAGSAALGLMLLAGGAAGLGYGLVYPLLNALAYERLPAHQRGRGLSLVAAGVDAGNASGAALAGVLAQVLGMGTMFLWIGLAVALTAVASRWSDVGSSELQQPG